VDGEPVEQLQQLQLVVEIMLEPQDDLIFASCSHEGSIALREVRQNGVSPAGTGPSCRTSRQAKSSPGRPDARKLPAALSPFVM
jgi:hypothetical protein